MLFLYPQNHSIAFVLRTIPVPDSDWEETPAALITQQMSQEPERVHKIYKLQLMS